MKYALSTFFSLVAVVATASPALADMQLATSKNCLACHAVASKVLGPSFKAIAAKYADQDDAPEKLATKVMKGGGGVWGAIPMPANAQVSPAEAQKLVAWILTQK